MIRLTLTFESREDDIWGFELPNIEPSKVREIIMEDPAQFLSDCYLKIENITADDEE